MSAYGLQVSCCNRPNQKQAGLGGRVVAEGGGGGTLADSTFRLSLVVVVHNKVCPCESSSVLSPAGMSMSMFRWPLNMQVSPEWFWTCCDAIKHLVTLPKKAAQRRLFLLANVVCKPFLQKLSVLLMCTCQSCQQAHTQSPGAKLL